MNTVAPDSSNGVDRVNVWCMAIRIHLVYGWQMHQKPSSEGEGGFGGNASHEKWPHHNVGSSCLQCVCATRRGWDTEVAM